MSATKYYTFQLHSGGAWHVAKADGIVVAEWRERKDAKRVAELLELETAELRAELDQERDIRSDMEHLIANIAQNLCVSEEPHQSFDERLIVRLASICHDANKADELRAEIERMRPVVAGVDAALELMELAGMHDDSDYQVLKRAYSDYEANK